MQTKLLIDRFEGDDLVVTNCSTGDVLLGSVLTALYAITVEGVREEFVSKLSSRPIAVHLTIMKSRIFSAAIPCIPLGYSAAIEIAGDGIEDVRTMLAQSGPSIQIFLDSDTPNR